MQRFLIVNPRSGTGSPGAEELRNAAQERDIDVHLLAKGDDLQDVARSANADVLGMAGGDGSLAAVAEVAIEQDIPLVCIPSGTRNHFARTSASTAATRSARLQPSTGRSDESMQRGSATDCS